MIYQLNKNITQELSNYPEAGMGYQYIEANIEGSPIYAKEDFIVLNGQFAILMDNYFESELKKISLSFFQYNISNCPFLEIKNFKVLNPAFVNQLKFLVKEDSRKEQKPATENDKENANGDELFVRLSAFEEDIRINKKNKCLLPGSYTTTASDALRCKVENDNPIDRYALPNELPVEWAFYIQPQPNDILQRGFVQPHFGKRGGGREVYFEKGTSHRTFITQTKWAI